MLALGSRGQEVTDLQGLLTSAGFTVAQDGIFGPVTAAAVRAFQLSNGLTPDGLYGPQTQSALIAAVRPGVTTPTPPPPLMVMDPIQVTGRVTPFAGVGIVGALAIAGGAFLLMKSKGKGSRRRKRRR